MTPTALQSDQTSAEPVAFFTWQKARGGRILELDGLRAIAILLVIGCHYHAFAAPLGGLLKFGWLGVDIFFVLSGFLITSILMKMKGAPKSLKSFYGRRMRRIAPPLVLTLLLISVGCLLVKDYGFFTSISLVKNLFFLQSFGNSKAVLSGLAHHELHSLSYRPLPLAADGIEGPLSLSAGILWSLSIEEYFYLLWAPVVLWFSRTTVLAIASTICVVEFFLRWICFSGRPDYFSIFYRFDALIYGAIAALFMDLILRHKNRSLVILAIQIFCAGGLLTAMLLYLRPVMGREIRDSALFMVAGIPLVSLAVAGILMVLSLQADSDGLIFRGLRSWPMRSIGTISYTLYLVHVFFYLLLTRVFGFGLVGAVASLIAAVSFAALSWKFVESPILTETRRFVRKPS